MEQCKSSSVTHVCLCALRLQVSQPGSMLAGSKSQSSSNTPEPVGANTSPPNQMWVDTWLSMSVMPNFPEKEGLVVSLEDHWFPAPTVRLYNQVRQIPKAHSHCFLASKRAGSLPGVLAGVMECQNLCVGMASLVHKPSRAAWCHVILSGCLPSSHVINSTRFAAALPAGSSPMVCKSSSPATCKALLPVLFAAGGCL